MKQFLDLIQWFAANYQRPIQLLVFLVSIFPFVVIAVLFFLLLGQLPSPLLNALERTSSDHKDLRKKYAALVDSMVQINRVAGEYYGLLETHSRESKRKEQLIQFLVLEGCRRDNIDNQVRCERLEETLKELEH